VFDGFSIGSNDLTQLVLRIDRDSGAVAHLFDERNEAVLRMIGGDRRRTAQASPSGSAAGAIRLSEFAEWLVKRASLLFLLTRIQRSETALLIAKTESRATAA
jgi:pyruvate,water dikinase